MSVRLILDIGSNHGNSVDRVKEIVDLCAEVGAELKFQLFKNLPPNIELDMKVWDAAVRLCEENKVPLFASVWDLAGIDLLEDSGCKTVKIAYSQNKKTLLIDYAVDFKKMECIVSTDFSGPRYKGCKHLFCVPQYPVYQRISFEGIFYSFDGFSDHTLGLSQTIDAIRIGVNIIEKHITTERNDFGCPDAVFSIKPSQARHLRTVINDYDSWE